MQWRWGAKSLSYDFREKVSLTKNTTDNLQRGTQAKYLRITFSMMYTFGYSDCKAVSSTAKWLHGTEYEV